jgi:hypothetical protein
VASLPELQAGFAAALRGDRGAFAEQIDADALDASGRLQIYCNNARAIFVGALECSYPVLRRRVGEDYFRQLAHAYRERHPSRSGDLHWVGRDFPAFVEANEAGTGYEWLADLARLEWACECSLVAGWSPPCGVDALAGVDAEDIPGLRLDLQPSLGCVSASYPVLEVWKRNQPGEPGDAVDLSTGPQHVLVACGPDGLELRDVPPDICEFARALQQRATLGAALDASGLPMEKLAGTLALLFGAELVIRVAVASAERAL